MECSEGKAGDCHSVWSVNPISSKKGSSWWLVWGQNCQSSVVLPWDDICPNRKTPYWARERRQLSIKATLTPDHHPATRLSSQSASLLMRICSSFSSITVVTDVTHCSIHVSPSKARVCKTWCVHTGGCIKTGHEDYNCRYIEKPPKRTQQVKKANQTVAGLPKRRSKWDLICALTSGDKVRRK